ncbi:MAG: UPF0262 family protein [Hyphomonadaceae bacterium]
MSEAKNRLVDIQIDETSLAAATSEALHERRIAIFDLLEGNEFALEELDTGPYALMLSIQDARLVFDVKTETGEAARTIVLSLTPFRSIIKDYFLVCDSYYAAIRNATPTQIEAIDMGRRGLHNEGSELLAQRLSGKIRVDHDTARRLFTLICALHVRG